jgi:hypothetical protein
MASPRPAPFLTPGSALPPHPPLSSLLHAHASLPLCSIRLPPSLLHAHGPIARASFAVMSCPVPSCAVPCCLLPAIPLCQSALCPTCPCSLPCANSLNTHKNTHTRESREGDDERGEDKGLSGAGQSTRGGRTTSPRPQPDPASAPDHAQDDLSPEARFVHHVRST